MWRHALIALVMIVSLVAGFWYGGTLERGLSVAAVAALALCVVLADLLGSPERWQSRVATALMAGIVFAAGWYLAGREIDAAYAECALRGEEVRQALEVHRASHGSYPGSLDDLAGFEIPGARLLRRGLLEYHTTQEGYTLSFRDAVSRNSATEDRSFFAR